MSKEVDLGWENHQWVNQDEFLARTTKEWHVINDTYFNGKYDFDGRMSKDKLKEFAWKAYEHCMAIHYDAAGVVPGNRLRDADFLEVTNRKTSYAGLCRKFGPLDGNGAYMIILSYKYYEDWGNAHIIDTLYHEISHLTYFNHEDDFWADGERIGHGLQPQGVKMRPAKFRLFCSECGDEFFYLSRPNKYWRCGKCHPDWEKFWALGADRPFMKVEKYTGPEILLQP